MTEPPHIIEDAVRQRVRLASRTTQSGLIGRRQPLSVLNSDKTLHNPHDLSRNRPEFGIGTPATGLKTEFIFDRPEVMIAVRCDVHRWMSAYVGVLDHPFFAVTDGDGRFTLENVPAGEYVVAAWHETFGVRERAITVEESQTVEISVGFAE